MSKPRGLGLTQGSTLLAAALMDGPAIYHAFVVKDMPAQTAMTRFLICIPAAAVLLMIWHTIIDPYRRKGAPLRAATERALAERAIAERLDQDDTGAGQGTPVPPAVAPPAVPGKPGPPSRRGSD